MTTTNRPPALPTAALLALEDGRLIEAIKVIREVEHLDLRAAKERVEAYAATNPALQARIAESLKATRKKIRGWVLAFDAVLVVGFLYWFFGR